jgi:2-polyprenyl-3-methyl-5-hydroxy-6-metoxy-1,4-benzoquinol methylase
MTSTTRQSESVAIAGEKPRSVADSPYQFKKSDAYSSHSAILRLAGKGRGRRLLDVGAAHGYLASELRSQGFEVTGIEADTVLGEEAAKHCDEFLLLDLDGALPSFPRPFDVMVFGDVLEHLKDPAAVLQEFAGHLRDDGAVIISLPNVANIYVRLNLLFGRFDYQDRGLLDRTHLRFFTRKSFRQFLQDAGLEVEQLTATPIPLPLVVPAQRQGAMFAALHNMNAWLARTWQTLFGYQFVAVARKAGKRDFHGTTS